MLVAADAAGFHISHFTAEHSASHSSPLVVTLQEASSVAMLERGTKSTLGAGHKIGQLQF